MRSSLNLYKPSKKLYLIFVAFFLFNKAFSQKVEDKQYYLIDNVILDELTAHDKNIIDSCLSIYHRTNIDYLKIKTVFFICDNIGDDRWSKYQEYLYEYIETEIRATTNQRRLKVLKLYLAYSLNNLAIMELNRSGYSNAANYYQESLQIAADCGDSAGMANAYGGISYMYLLQGKSEIALDYNTKALSIFEKLDDEFGTAKNLQNLGNINHMTGNVLEAKDNFESAANLFKNHKNLYGEATCYNELALINVSIGDISKAIHYYTKAIAIFETIGAIESAAISYTNAGDLYFKQKEVVKALANYTKSIEIYKKIDANPYESYCLSKIAEVFLYNNDYDSALLYFNKSLAIDSADNNIIGIARALNSIGMLYFRKGEIDKSINLCEKALLLFEVSDYVQATTSCKINLAEIYLEKGDTKKAENFALNAFKEAMEIGYPKLIQDVSSILWKLAKERGDFKSALEMFTLHIQMRDSLINLDNKAILIRKDLESDYNQKTFELKEKHLLNEIKLIAQEEKLQKQKFIAIILTAIIVIIILLVLWRRSKYELNIKWLQEDILKTQMKPHFIFNVMVSIQSLIVQGRYKEAIHYLSEIATFMRSSLSNISSKKISFEKELELARQYLDLEKLRFKEKLDFEIETNLHDDIKRFQVPPFITQPIIENAIIHGFKNITYTGIVKINAAIQDGNLIINVCDNGVGIQVEKKSKSEGIKIVRARLKLFNPRNKFILKEQSEGTCAQITFFPTRNNLLKN